MEGIFPHLRLQGDLRLTTNGKQIQLDEVQVKLLYTMADSKNIEKPIVLHGPEGSGKTLLALEVAKMKLSHYLKKEKLKDVDDKNSLRLIICGSYVGEDRVPFLLKQLKVEIKDIQDFCTVEFKPVANLPMSTPKKFAKSIEKLLDLGNQNGNQTIVLMDELFPGFETSQWTEFKGIDNVDFVLALRHAFNDGLCLGRFNWFKRKQIEFQDVMDQEGVHEFKNVIFCHLRKSFRCTQELLSLAYYMLMHAAPEEKMYKSKSFYHHFPMVTSGKIPIWLEVESLAGFIKYASTDLELKDAKDVMVIYDTENVKDVIDTLKNYCSERKWRQCLSTSVTGSEASTVIIYDLKSIHFESISRAVLQLIFVTTKTSK